MPCVIHEREWVEILEQDLNKVSKGWSVAMSYSKERLRRVHKLDGETLENVQEEGTVLLETVCLFVHACVKRGQYRIPVEFWRLLLSQYGIVVYPTAMTEDIGAQGVNADETFTEAYSEHIVMLGKFSGSRPPPNPFEYLQQPPPVYER